MIYATEIYLIITGVIGVIGNVTTLLGLLVSGRRTPTHIYLWYMTIFALIQQFVSPAFNKHYVNQFYMEFNVQEFLTVMFLSIVFGFVIMLIVFFLMDYIKLLSTYKIVVVIIHFISQCVWILLYYFVIDEIGPAYLAIVVFLLIYLSFHLLFIVQGELECLQRRKQTDNESRLRHMYILTFISLTIVTILIFLLENFMFFMFTGWPSFGFIAFGFTQLYPVFYFIVLYKLDNKFNHSLLGFFKMCSFKINKFENLPNDNGRLINEEP